LPHSSTYHKNAARGVRLARGTASKNGSVLVRGYDSLMSSELFERLAEERRSGSIFTLADWLAEHPVPESSYTQSLAGIARRCAAGEPFMDAVREFLDEFTLRPEPLRLDAMKERPARTGDERYDTFLGALAEHLALALDGPVPSWSRSSERFLDRFWFVSGTPGFRALALAGSPAAFRRRGIFITPDSLARV
jgi:hypothetical protein